MWRRDRSNILDYPVSPACDGVSPSGRARYGSPPRTACLGSPCGGGGAGVRTPPSPPHAVSSRVRRPMYLYVMSRPHSGSTILDILLGNTAAVESVGQLVSDMGKLDNPCACGATIRVCPFWREVRSTVEAAGVGWGEAMRASVGQAHVGRLWDAFPARDGDPSMGRLAEITAIVVRAIAETAGKPV